LPGTEVFEFDGADIVKTGKDGMVLVPQPSRDPNDPLNWTWAWKLAVIINQTAFVFISVLTPLSIAPLTPIFIKRFDKSLSQVALLTGAAVIALGYANLVIIPFSNIFGRRLTSLICAMTCVLSNIWQAVATSYGSFLAARVVSGLGAAANESIMTVVVADVIFLHQRGSWMGLYFWAYFMGTFVGPIISGNVAASMGYQWFFWICAILSGANFITLFFFSPETKFRRIIEVHRTTTAETSSLSDKPRADEKGVSTPISTDVENPADIHPHDRIVGHGHPSITQRFSVLPTPDLHALKFIFRDVTSPLRLAFYPIILWASMSMGFAANCVLNLNLTQSQVFAAPPYNFSPSAVGLVNLAFVGGAAVGLMTAGPFGDWVSWKLTKGNHGVREPEMRLGAMIPYICFALIGNVIVAVGYQRSWPWEVIVVIGFGFVGLISVAIPTIAITYAVDCYKPIAGEIMVIATICKNTFGFGQTYYINDWAIADGYIPPIMMVGGITTAISLLGVVVFGIWGKNFRRWTKDRWVHEL